MSDIIGKVVKPTAEFIEDLARKLPEALGKGHHRIGENIHNAADAFDRTEDDLTAKAGHHPHDHGSGHHDPADVAGTGSAAAAGATGSARAVGDADRQAARTGGEHGAGHPGDGQPPDLRPSDSARASIPGGEKHCASDPVDVATGDMVMSATDVELPGTLTLVLRRTHVSSYRNGRLFGPCWASTLDQHLQLDADGVVFASFDGMRLEYPPPHPGRAVLPLKGPRLPLSWSGAPGEPMRITAPRSGETLVFDDPRPAPGRPGAVVLRLTGIEDRNGNGIDITWNARDLPEYVTHRGGYRIAVDHHPTLPRITGYRLLDTDGPGTHTPLLTFGHSEDGDLTDVTDSSGLPLRLTHDEKHRVTGWTDRNGTTYAYTYDDAGRVVATEGSGGLLSSTFAYDDSTRTTVVTDSLGHPTSFEHDDAYRLVRTTDPLGNTTVQGWDADHRNVVAVTDPLGGRTGYTYDTAGAPTAVVRADGHTDVAVNNEYGLPVAVTRADGTVWRMEYDARGNLVAETDPAGATTSFTYAPTGAVGAITDAAGRSVRIDTDATGMPTAVTDAEGGTTRYERDAFGRVVTQTSPEGVSTRFAWTTEGRPSRCLRPDGTVERRTYDGEGNLVEHVGPDGSVTRLEFGGFDLPTARVDPDGSRLEFGYDSELRVTSVTNPLGAVWRYFYDAAGRLEREEDFEGRARRYRHDAAGRLVEQVDGAGGSTVYVRDALGDVAEQHTAEGITRYTYDLAGNALRVTDGRVELRYERDAAGRVLAETCDGATTRSTYDVLGRRTGRVTPSGAESRWTYDGRDQPVSLETAGRTVTFAYDASGREVERRAGAALLAQTWDPNGRLGTQTLSARDRTGTGTSRTVQRRAYHYGPDGVLERIDDLVNGDRALDIDARGRVSGVRAATWTERYAYDAAGNVTRAGTWAAGEEPGSGEAPDGPGIRYEHDARGRVVTRVKKRLSRKPDVWRYTWDGQDRLVGLITPDGTRWAYRYDPFGRRIAKERLGPDGVTPVAGVTFAWDGFVLGEQVAWSDGEAPACTVWNWERDRFSPVTQVERVPAGELSQDWVDAQFYAIVTDLVGTPAELVDEEGELAWSARSSVWGAPLPGTGPARADCPLRFPGQYHDPESGLHYNYHRHYDPDTGQYASVDPLGLAAGPNPRAYVANPFTAVDPLGLAPDCDRALAAARGRADAEQAKPGANKNTRPTSAAGLVAPGHEEPFNGASVKGGGDHDLHPAVRAAYDRVPEPMRTGGNQHGRCGEAEALSKAMKAGVDPRGGVSAAVDVRAPGNPKHGSVKPPCPSCAHVLRDWNITAVTE